MLWMNNTGLFSTRCDLVDECTEIMLRMGKGEMACYTSCARLVPSPREPGPLFANDPKSAQPRLTEVACWAHARRAIYEARLPGACHPIRTTSPLPNRVRWAAA